MLFILYILNTIFLIQSKLEGTQNVIKKIIRKRNTFTLLYCLLILFIWFTYKMNWLSVPASTLTYMIQNIIHVLSITILDMKNEKIMLKRNSHFTDIIIHSLIKKKQWMTALWEPSLTDSTMYDLCFSSVQFSCSVVSDSLRPHELQHAWPPSPSPTPGVDPNPCPSSRWCHPTISSSVVPFSSWPQSFSASGSFQMNQLFTSGGQSTGISVSTSVLPMNTQDWSPLGWTGWISLQSKEPSRVFSNTTVQKHQFCLYGPTVTSIHDHWKNHSLN